ncbi:MAG: AAA family ATPase [Verrucomicrobiota bacterium]
MSKLKAKDPKTVELSKPKFVIFGASGAGKTWFGLDFPNVYYIDTEGGAARQHYMERLAKSGGKYMGLEEGALDFETVIDQFKALATEKHGFKTVIVDSITKLFNTAIANETERLRVANEKNEFGRDKKAAIAFMRRIIAATTRLDMNVIFIAHEKAEWGMDDKGDRCEIGKVEDCWEKLRYELDLALQVQKRGASRFGVVKKSRLLGFPEGSSFKLDKPEFEKLYGMDVIGKPAKIIELASLAQVAEVNRLVDLLKVDRETTDKWLEKANAETFAEFNVEQADKIIINLNSKLK